MGDPAAARRTVRSLWSAAVGQRSWLLVLLLAVAGAQLSFWAIIALLRPEGIGALAAIQAVYLATGREPAILAGIQWDPSPAPALLWGAVLLMDALLIAGGALAFTEGLARLQRSERLGPILEHLAEGVAPYRSTIDRWGLPGLAFFLWLPALSTGPFAAVLLGLVAGIPPRRLVPTLLVSAAAVDAFWIAVLGRFEREPLVALGLFVGLLVLGIAATILVRRRAARKAREAEAGGAAGGPDPTQEA